MRKYLVHAICTVAIVSVAALGCTVKVKSGTPDTPPPPPKQEPPPPPPKVEAPKPKPKPKFGGFNFKVKDNRVELPGPVMFETGTATLKPESDAVLEIVFQYLTAKKEVTKHRIEGHTDTDDSDANNQILSEKRAMAVAHWLVTKGIDCKRLVPVGFGESKLKVTPEKTAEDKAVNRRVDFVNAELKGAPIGGMPVDGGGKIAGDPCK